jgi:hypothetical protein
MRACGRALRRSLRRAGAVSDVSFRPVGKAYLAEESLEHLDGGFGSTTCAIESVCSMVELGRSLGS